MAKGRLTADALPVNYRMTRSGALLQVCRPQGVPLMTRLQLNHMVEDFSGSALCAPGMVARCVCREDKDDKRQTILLEMPLRTGLRPRIAEKAGRRLVAKNFKNFATMRTSASVVARRRPKAPHRVHSPVRADISSIGAGA